METFIGFYVKLKTRWQTVMASEQGSTVVEYALLVALIAAVAVSVLDLLGTSITTAFNTSASKLK